MATNAILAINSLDRYTGNEIFEFLFFEATWTSGSTNLTWVSGAIPVVGATIQAPGIPIGATVTNVLLPDVTISVATTADQILAAQVLQRRSVTFPGNQPVQSSLLNSYQSAPPFANNFIISSPGALIYGYMKKLIVSQIQVQYNVPTVNEDMNDFFVLYSETKGDFYNIVIPNGFYTGTNLAAVLQVIIQQTTGNPQGQPPIADMIVTYSPTVGFSFSSATDTFSFVAPSYLKAQFNYPDDQVTNIYKTLRLLGMTPKNDVQDDQHISDAFPIFLYTPYIDIYSDILTNYQNIKDTNTSVLKNKGLIARVYVSGTGLQNTTDIGTVPFTFIADLNSPKIIQWSPDIAVPSIDFQVYDQYNQLLPMGPVIQSVSNDNKHQTEFQITLLCTE
jgi:hypothetical protein